MIVTMVLISCMEKQDAIFFEIESFDLDYQEEREDEACRTFHLRNVIPFYFVTKDMVFKGRDVAHTDNDFILGWDLFLLKFRSIFDVQVPVR